MRSLRLHDHRADAVGDEGLKLARDAGALLGDRVIPPDLAYQAQGFPPVIGPDETLVFIIDLLSVNG